MDDSILGLYLDAFIPSLKKWIRINVEHAKDDNKKRRENMNKAVDSGLLSTADLDDSNK